MKKLKYFIFTMILSLSVICANTVIASASETIPVADDMLMADISLDKDGNGNVTKTFVVNDSEIEEYDENKDYDLARASVLTVKVSLSNWFDEHADVQWRVTSSKPNITRVTGYGYVCTPTNYNPTCFLSGNFMSGNNLGGVMAANGDVGGGIAIIPKHNTTVRVGYKNVYITLIDDGIQSIKDLYWTMP